MYKWKETDSIAITTDKWNDATKELNKIDAEIADITKHPLYKKRMKEIEQLARIAKKYPEFLEDSPYIKTNKFAGKLIEDIVK